MSPRGAQHSPARDRDPADPERLPRQRNGITPQMHGRYPDYNVLDEAGHWDEVTRRVVLARVENPPSIRFFDEAEAKTLAALCDVVLHQPREPRIPVLAFVDEKLYEGRLDGYQHFDMPDDRETWRIVARGLDWEAEQRGHASFADFDDEAQVEICEAFSQGKLGGGAWSRVNVSRACGLVMRHAVEAFYAHPWAWNEIGFGGPAYPRGYAAFGSPHLHHGDREPWEGEEAFATDPVRDTKARGVEGA